MTNLFRKIFTTGIVTEKTETDNIPKRFRGKIDIEQVLCTLCGNCVKNCPAHAIEARDGHICIKDEACIFCGVCVETCKHGALTDTNSMAVPIFSHQLANEEQALKEKIKRVLGRSLHIRHVDAGSCNACDFEMAALTNPLYDIQQYGIDFVASPRHADLLMVTGVVTRNLCQALKLTYEATPSPKLVMAVGACAAGGETFGSSYAHYNRVDLIVPVDIYVPGCPPRPQALIQGLLLALDKF